MKLRKTLILLLAAALLAALPGLDARAGAAADYDMPYYIVVDLVNQVVTVYDSATSGIVRQMLCSTGKTGNTPQGTFYLPENGHKGDRKPWYYIQMFRRYVKYATRIRGQYLFHSMPYRRKSLQSVDAKAASELGEPTSHGCIRLRWQDAEFIALNCLPGTAVKITAEGTRDEGLRELLLQQSYVADDGMSYESFLGISHEEGALGRSSEGREVLNLQYRLRDLGLYDGALDGVYDSTTVNAVRKAQYLLGRETDGIATLEMQELLYGDGAPTAMDVRLAPGMSGPAVRVLQGHLATLGLYGDPPDSVYDAAVEEAVRQFQRAYGYDEDGAATPTVQKAVAYEADRVAETFGGADYACEWVNEPLALARVSAKSGTRLRREPDLQSRSVRRMSMGQVVIVLEKGKEWSRVRCGDDEGYVRNDLAVFGERDISVLRYTAAGEDLVYVVGNGAADYYAGAKLPCEVFEEYLAAADQQVDVESLVTYVTVDTGDGDVQLNLRETPDPEGTVLDTVASGTQLKVLRRASEWTLVSYRGAAGYLLNRYLKFWTGPVDALDETLDADEAQGAEPRFAVVQSASGMPAEVYQEDLDDARVLGHLPDGTRVEVLEILDGWCRIRYEDHEGYMIGEDLQFEGEA